jgi:hypothetical protein
MMLWVLVKQDNRIVYDKIFNKGVPFADLSVTCQRMVEYSIAEQFAKAEKPITVQINFILNNKIVNQKTFENITSS